MSKSVELLASPDDAEPTRVGDSRGDDRSRLNLNGSRQLSRSATELRDRAKDGESSSAGRSPEHHRRSSRTGDSGVIQRLRHHRHVSVAQRTHTFFATLKSRWVRSRSKERKKSRDAAALLDAQPKGSANQESDYAADYSSEHSRSSSATQSPARHYLNHPESPLARPSRSEKAAAAAALQDDSSGRCSDGSPKAHRQPGGLTSAGPEPEKEAASSTGAQQQAPDQEAAGAGGQNGESAGTVQDEGARRRELALRQHAFFQLRLHLRRGANLVAMDRCGASDPYVKIKCGGRLLHKSRTVHRELNPVWDESVTLPIEDPFQPLNFKVFDYDWGLQDDFMGAALLDLTQLDLGYPQDVTLELKDPARPRQHLGEIFISATLWPRNQQEKEQDSSELPEEANFDRLDVEAEQKVSEPSLLSEDSRSGKSSASSGSSIKSKNSNVTSASAATEASSAAESASISAAENTNSHPDSPDFFDKIKVNFKDKMEDIHRYFQRSSRLADVNRKLKSQIWSSVVTIVLVEAKNLLPMDIDGLSDPYVKFRLGTEKYKSKVANKTLNPVWLEQFDLHLYEDPYLGQELEVTVWDRDRSHQDDLMGRAVIDLATLERETTHRLWRDLEDGAGNIFLLLTISGTTASETISDLAAHEETHQERAQLIQKYSMVNALQRVRDVGHLTVKVYRAQGLAAADLGGKSDPFCVLELVNSRLQTQTEYKTLAPNWQKIFTFNVKDINSVLEVTVYDEDRDHKVEFLGKVAIPLLKVRNGEKRWYVLKDKKLRCRAKGNCPQILLEMTVVWNVLRACIRTLNPKEKKYMEPEMKFKRQVFLRNVLRLKAIIVIFIDLGKYMQSCWEWESKMRSVLALVFFIVGVYYFEPYMIPTAAFLILLKYYVVAVLTGAPLPHQMTVHVQDHCDVADEGPPTPGDDDDDEDDKDKEEKKSLKERLQAIQEVTQTVQNSIGYIASLCERVKNLFNFTVPYLSYLAMTLAILGMFVLYLIPVRYLILAWGVNKFARKIFRPHTVPNNELLDLISRVPDDEELLNYRELKPLPTADCESRSSGASATSGSSTGTATRRELRKRQKAAA